MSYEPYLRTFCSLTPLLLSLFLYFLDIVSLRPLALIYLSYCIYCQFDSKIQLIYAPTPKIQSIMSHCSKILSENFRPLFFFPMPIFQTSLAPIDFNDFWGTKSTLTSHAQKVPTAGTVLDWVINSKEAIVDFSVDTKNKLLVIIPGLTGSVKDGYIKEICYQALNKNYRPVVYNTRWLTKPVVLPKDGFVDPLNDFIETMEFLHKNYANYKMFAVGTSHGANLITKYLGTVGNQTKLLGAVSVGNYFDLYASSKKIGAFWDYMLAIILKMALGKQISEFRNLPEKLKFLECEKALETKIVKTKDFDELFTRRLLGYQSVNEYYKKFGCKDVLENIKKPLLCMQSLDDPICHYTEIPTEKSKINENLIFYITKKGGHCAWIQGIFNPSIFFPKPALEFLEAINKELF